MRLEFFVRSAGAVGVFLLSFGDALQEGVVSGGEEFLTAVKVDFIVLEGLEAETDAVGKIVGRLWRRMLREALDHFYALEIQSLPAFEEAQI